jgi:uncharacterized protein (DUF885 family)
MTTNTGRVSNNVGTQALPLPEVHTRGKRATKATVTNAPLGGLALAPSATQVGAVDPAKRAKQIRAIAEETWEEIMRHEPSWRTMEGDRSADTKLEDLSPKEWERHFAKMRKLKAKMEAIDRNGLSAKDLVIADVIDASIQNVLDLKIAGAHLWGLNSMWDYHSTVGELGSSAHTIRSREDVDSLITRYQGTAKMFGQLAQNLAAGLADGASSPKVIVERIISQVTEQIDAPLAESPFLGVMKELPENMSEEEKTRARADVEKAVTEHVLPALKAYRDFLKDELLPQARETIGLSAVPNGARFYETRIRKYTDLELTAKQVHDTGLAEVGKLEKEMKQLLANLGAEGDLSAGLKAVMTRPEQHAESREAFIAYAQALTKKAEEKMPPLFGVETAPIIVEDAPFESAAFAIYIKGPRDGSRPGRMQVNSAGDDPKMNLPSVIAHEYTHHLQFSAANANEDLPALVVSNSSTATIEGGALYGELVAKEHGLYEDDMAKLGAAAMQMLRAVRLVVDTGIHAFGWTRQEAIDYMAARTTMDEASCAREIDRYISMPGQALAYMIGQREIMSLRDQAREALGDRFDEPAFHAVVLESGGAPLPALRRIVEGWIAEAQ